MHLDARRRDPRGNDARDNDTWNDHARRDAIDVNCRAMHRRPHGDAWLVHRRPMLAPAGRIDLHAIEDNAGAKRCGSLQSLQEKNPRIARDWNQIERFTLMSLAGAIAL